MSGAESLPIVLGVLHLRYRSLDIQKSSKFVQSDQITKHDDSNKCS